MPDKELPDPHSIPADIQLVVEEAKIGCTTDAFIQAGFVNPQKLLFARERVTRVRDVARKRLDNLDALQTAFAEVHRDHPFHEPPDFVAALRSLIDRADFKATLELD
jgi:hypothetical protein